MELYLAFCLSFLLFVVITTKLNNQEKGSRFEQFIARVLKSKFKKSFVFNNIYLKNEYTNYMNEIDIILINKNGIFVIEIKDWFGIITPGEKYWSVFINGQEEFRYSPILQNNTKVKTLSKTLKIPQNKIQSVICFSNRYQKLKIKQDNIVTGKKGLIKFLKKKNQKEILSKEEVETIGNTLKNIKKKTSKSVKKQHIKKLKTANI